jgi:hypothetical protein
VTRKPTDRAVRTLLRQKADRARKASLVAEDVAEAERALALGFVAGGWPRVWAWREARAERGRARLGRLTAMVAALGVG